MPYNPGNEDRSGQIIADGISRATGTISDAIVQRGKDTKRLKALRGSAIDLFGLEPDKVDKMSAEDIEAHMKGLVLKSTLDEAKQRQQAHADEIGQRNAGAQFQQFLDPTSGGQQGPPAPVNAERILGAAAKSGYRLPPQLITQMMRESDPTNWQDVMPREFEIGGAKGAVGKGGQFQFLPQTTPDSLTAIPVLDAEGNVIGQRVPTTKGGTAPLPAPKTPKEVPSSFFDPYHKAIQAIGDAESSASKTDDELKALASTGTPAEKRKRYQQAAKQAQENLRKHLELYKSQGYGTPEFWEGLYQQNNLTAPGNQNIPAASSGAGSGAPVRRFNPATRKLE